MGVVISHHKNSPMKHPNPIWRRRFGVNDLYLLSPSRPLVSAAGAALKRGRGW
jgi:hypothetical protein